MNRSMHEVRWFFNENRAKEMISNAAENVRVTNLNVLKAIMFLNK